MMEAFHSFLKNSPMMAPRLVELHRVLRETGSLYLHCDPTASHFLKLTLDGIFGPLFFKNEIIWKRTTAHSNVYSNYGDVTDSIFFYAKSDAYTWNQLYRKVDDLEAAFPNVDSNGRRWRSENMRNPGIRPNLHYAYTASNGITYQPHPNGWTVSIEKMNKLDAEGRLHFPSKPSGRLRLKYYAVSIQGLNFKTCGTISARSVRKHRRDSVIQLKNLKRCSNASLAPQQIPATWCSIRFADVAQPFMPRRNSDGNGSGLMSLISRSI